MPFKWNDREDTASPDIFFFSLFCRARAAQPNAAHYALAAFSFASIRDQVAPGSTFTLITQNVDGLSPRALRAVISTHPKCAEEAQAASEAPHEQQPRILEMHGRLFDVVCTSPSCKHREEDLNSPIVSALAGTEDIVEAGTIEPLISKNDLPKCSKCGELTRPGVVWFGEIPWYLDEIQDLVDQADLCLVVGTSSTVSSMKPTRPL